MHIHAIDLCRVPIAGATSESGRPMESIFVLLESGEHVGVGEVCLETAPTVSDEWSAGAFACLRDHLAPAMLGRSIDSGEMLRQRLAPFRGNHAAKSALDVAWWSLRAVAQRKPLYRLLGGTTNRIRLSATIGASDSAESLFAQVRAALARYDLVTLSCRPGWDVEMLRAVRQQFGSEPIAIDCDECCSLGQRDMFFRMEDFFLSYIEQPLAADDLVGHAMLQESLRTPIALDQSITSLERVEQALDLGSCRLLRVNLARVGGITPALEIVRACRAGGVPCAAGGGSFGRVSAAATAALATLCDGGPMPLESSAEPSLMSQVGGDGKLEVRLREDTAGLGFETDAQVLTAGAVERVRLA
jgi:O-succinylbenzoate synthase